MMNALALGLVLTSLVTAGFFSPNPEKPKSTEDVIVKEGRRVVVVEYEKDEGNTKVSISPQDSELKGKLSEKIEDVKEGTKEFAAKSRDKMSEKIGDVKEASESKVEEINSRFKPRELVCDAYGRCKHKIASVIGKPTVEEAKGAIGKVKDTVSDSAHKAFDKVEEAKEKMYEKASGIRDEASRRTEGAKEKVLEKANGVKEEASRKMEEAREKVSEKASGVKEEASKKTEGAKEKVVEKASGVKEEASRRMEGAKEKVVEKASGVKEEASRRMEGAKEKVSEVGEEASRRVVGAKEKVSEIGEEASRRVEGAKEKVSEMKKEGEKELGEIMRHARDVVGEVFNYIFTVAPVTGVLHLMGFAAAYGMCVWVTFGSSHVLAGALPRQQFALVQSRIYPLYFKAMGYSVGMALLGHLMSPRKILGTRFRGLDLMAALALVLVNLFYLEPRATKVMHERMKMEKEEGTRKEVHVMAPDSTAETAGRGVVERGKRDEPKAEMMFQLSQTLQRLNSNSSFVNVMTLVSLTWHLVGLGQRLHVVC